LVVKSDSDGTTYRAKVAYRYRVHGKDYTSGRVFFGDWLATSLSQSAARRRVMKYRTGSTVTVLYDPAQPSRAVLEPGINWQTWLEMAFGLLFAATALFFLRRG